MKKRFIAGAICPKCAEQDTMLAYEDVERKVMVRECVQCGFTVEISTVVNQPKEMITRVSERTDTESDAPVQVVKIIKP